MKRFALPIVVLLVSLSFIAANADVLIKDTQVGEDNTLLLTSGTIGTGSGEPGNYVVMICSNSEGTDNAFNEPSPLSWTALDDLKSCGGPNCTQGILGTFVDDPNNQIITCSWDQEADMFTAGSIRYSNVDRDNPIIDVKCDAGVGTEAIAPSIITEEGSQVLRTFTIASNPTLNPTTANVENRVEIEGDGSLEETFFEVTQLPGGRLLSVVGRSALFESGGPTDTATLALDPPVELDWKACTIGIRMGTPVVSAVPTISEWGLIAMAVIPGLVGFFVIRRKKVTV